MFYEYEKNFTQDIFFMFGTKEVLATQPLNTSKAKINITKIRANIWQCALKPFSLDWCNISGPVCSYYCLINKIWNEYNKKKKNYLNQYILVQVQLLKVILKNI